MNVFDLVDLDEIDDLPDDPNLAFTAFIRTAQGRLAGRLNSLNMDDESEWRIGEEARHSFMNMVIAAAKHFGVEPFASMEVPTVSRFSNEDQRQFKADLDHYMTQLLLDNSARTKRDSVLLDPKSRDRIRAHLHGLKECLDNASITESKRAALRAKLADFENELDKKRLSFLAVTKVTLEILAVPGALWGSHEIVTKLLNNVLTTVSEAKVAEDETRRLPPASVPKALSPPRKPVTTTPHNPFMDADLDDDVPF